MHVHACVPADRPAGGCRRGRAGERCWSPKGRHQASAHHQALPSRRTRRTPRFPRLTVRRLHLEALHAHPPVTLLAALLAALPAALPASVQAGRRGTVSERRAWGSAVCVVSRDLAELDDGQKLGDVLLDFNIKRAPARPRRQPHGPPVCWHILCAGLAPILAGMSASRRMQCGTPAPLVCIRVMHVREPPVRERADRCAGGGAVNSRNLDYIRDAPGMLAPGGAAGALEQATCALDSLCIGSSRSQDSVRECGGIAALVAAPVGLLAPGRPRGRALAGCCGAPLRRPCAPHVCCPPVRPRPPAEAGACRADRDVLLIEVKFVYTLAMADDSRKNACKLGHHQVVADAALARARAPLHAQRGRPQRRHDRGARARAGRHPVVAELACVLPAALHMNSV